MSERGTLIQNDRAIALVGLAQATRLVDDIAQGRYAPDRLIESTLRSVLVLNPPTVASVIPTYLTLIKLYSQFKI